LLTSPATSKSLILRLDQVWTTDNPVKYGIKNLKRTGKISFSEIRLHKPSDQFPNTI
jgi:hypothetical protein